MRTLLIAPSFLAVYAAIVLSLAWLISASSDSSSPESGNFPSRAAFADWNRQMPIGRRIFDRAAAEEHEPMEEDQVF